MNTNDLIVQDLADIHHINLERVQVYNKSAYASDNLQLKILLNRELDNARDSVMTLNRLLRERFNITSETETKGQLFCMWSDFRPSFDDTGMNILMLNLEMADALMLQCYRVILTRPYLDSVSRNILEFQYQNNLSIFNNIKAFRATYQNHLNHSMASFVYRKSA